MSPEAAHDLSVPDLLRALNEKLGLECTWLQASPGVSVTVLESEVSDPRALLVNVDRRGGLTL